MRGRLVKRLGWGAWVGALLLLLFAELAAPHDPLAQRRDLPYAPPARPRFVDAEGKLHLRPFVYSWKPSESDPTLYLPDPSRRLPLSLFVAAPGNRVAGLLPLPIRLMDTSPPGELHLLGTDTLGRDLFSRLLHGGRLSLATALLATLLAVSLGGLGGVAAGLSEGWRGRLLTWLAELSLALPWLYLLLAVRGALPLELPAGGAWLLLSVLVGLAGWGRTALLVRSAVAGAREQTYVLAAIGLGLTPWQVLWRHVLPAAYGLLITQATLLLPRFLVAEVTLSLLGVGIGEPQPSWGNLLAVLLRPGEWRTHPWLLAPAVALVLLVLALQAIGERLNRRLAEGAGAETAANPEPPSPLTSSSAMSRA